MSKKLKIALDYDDTYTAHPQLFTLFVMACKALSDEVEIKFVTFRHESDIESGANGDIIEDAAALGIDIIYTNGKQKQNIYNADIWIDDKPALIPGFAALAMRLQSTNAEDLSAASANNLHRQLYFADRELERWHLLAKLNADAEDLSPYQGRYKRVIEANKRTMADPSFTREDALALRDEIPD